MLKQIEKEKEQKQKTAVGDKVKEEKKITPLTGLVPEPKPQVEEDTVPQLVRAFKVKRADYKDSLPVTGTVKSHHEIKLRFEIRGVLTSLKIKEGDVVKKGDLIAVVDKKDYLLEVSRAKGNLESQKSAYEAEEKSYELVELMYRKGAIIDKKLEEARLKVDSLASKVKASEEELNIAQAALDKTELFAPRDGVIVSKDAEEGEFVTPQDKIATLVDPDALYLEVGIVERDIPKIIPDQEAIIKIDAFPGKEFKGKVERITPLVKGKSRTMIAEVKILPDNETDITKVFPGMFAEVEIVLVDLKSTLLVPTRSLLRLTDDSYVVPYISPPSGATSEQIGKGDVVCGMSMKLIDVGYVGPDYAEIKTGLEDGDLVVAEATPDIDRIKKVKVIGIEEYGLKGEGGA